MSLFGAVADHYVASAPPTAYSGAVLADAPLGYWRLGEASGTTMVDSSGNGRNGTYAAGVTLGTAGLITGDTDTAVTVSTAGGAGAIANDTWMNVDTFTAEAVFNCTSLGTRNIITRDVSGLGSTSSAWRIRINSSKIQFLLWHTGLTTLTGSTTIIANTKYHVAVTYDGVNMKIYLNGVQDATSAQSGAVRAVNTQITIGDLAATGGQFVGVLDEAAFYGTALSSTRLAAHAVLV